MQIGNKFHSTPPFKMANVLMQWIGCQRFIFDYQKFSSLFFCYFFAILLGIKKTADIVLWNGFPSVLNIPFKEDFDFNFWRKPTYAIPTLCALVKNRVKMMLDDKRVEELPDSDIYKWIAFGPLSRIAVQEGNFITVDLGYVRDVVTDQGVYLSGPSIEI